MKYETSKESLQKAQKLIDLRRIFRKIFNTDDGQKILDYLHTYTRLNFPNFDNNNATYYKLGQQHLVEYMVALKNSQEINDKKVGEYNGTI